MRPHRHLTVHGEVVIDANDPANVVEGNSLAHSDLPYVLQRHLLGKTDALAHACDLAFWVLPLDEPRILKRWGRAGVVFAGQTPILTSPRVVGRHVVRNDRDRAHLQNCLVSGVVFFVGVELVCC